PGPGQIAAACGRSRRMAVGVLALVGTARGFLLHGDDERRGWRADGPAYTPEETDRYIEGWSQPGAATGMINYYRSSVRTPPQRAEGARIGGRGVTPPVAVRPPGCRAGRRGGGRG